LLRSTAAEDRPGEVGLEENSLPAVVLGGLSLSHLFLGVPAALIVGGTRFLSVLQLQLQAVGMDAVLPCSGHSLCR
jgi:hypothetical protein